MTETAAVPVGSISGIPLYANGAAPAGLLTKAGLEARRLKPAPAQVPAAYIRVRYYKTLAALYDPSAAAPMPPRTPGQDWAYRIRRTCPKCGQCRPYVVDGEMCGHCRNAEQARAGRLYVRTCQACGKVGDHPFAKDKQYPDWHRCPPCRVLRKAELQAEFDAGLERAQHCPDCGTRVQSKTRAIRRHRANPHYWARIVCDPCEAKRVEQRQQAAREAREAEQRQIQARREQIAELEQWARDMLADPNTVILDTETTGLGDGARIVQIAVVGADRKVLLDTLVNPGQPIPAEATAIHGITDAMVAGAPTFAEVLRSLERTIGEQRVLIYNKQYDVERLEHELALHFSDLLDPAAVAKDWFILADWEDAMIPYSDWCGEEDEWRGGYRWQRLNGGHQARGDCLAVVDVLKAMAKGGSDDEGDGGW